MRQTHIASASRLVVIPVRPLYAQPFHAAVEVGAIGGQPTRRLGYVSGGAVEGTLDQLPLVALEQL